MICKIAWFVAAFTFERLIIVRYPLKRSTICTVRRAKVIIGCLTIAAALVQTVSLFTTGITKHKSSSKNTTETISHNPFPNYYQVMRFINMIETFLTVAIPPILIVIMNALIVRSLVTFAKTFQVNGSKHRPRASSVTPPGHQVNIEVLCI